MLLACRYSAKQGYDQNFRRQWWRCSCLLSVQRGVLSLAISSCKSNFLLISVIRYTSDYRYGFSSRCANDMYAILTPWHLFHLNTITCMLSRYHDLCTFSMQVLWPVIWRIDLSMKHFQMAFSFRQGAIHVFAAAIIMCIISKSVMALTVTHGHNYPEPL